MKLEFVRLVEGRSVEAVLLGQSSLKMLELVVRDAARKVETGAEKALIRIF